MTLVQPARYNVYGCTVCMLVVMYVFYVHCFLTIHICNVRSGHCYGVRTQFSKLICFVTHLQQQGVGPLQPSIRLETLL